MNRFLRRLGLKRKRRHPVLVRVPVEGQEGESLFPSLQEIYQSSRSAFQRLLKRIRRTGGVRGGVRRRRSVVNTRVGRNVKPVAYRPGENLLAPLLTLHKAVQGGRYNLARKRLVIQRADLMGWDKLERESLTLILLVDTSRSSYYYIEIFRQILRSLAGHFNRKRDRMGLIVLQGSQARILNHPTHNFRVVTNSLAKLKIHGESPVADGLQKALAVAKLERYRNPGSLSLVVLLSDCYPEPLTRKFDDLFEEPAYKNAISAARLYKKERVGLLLINPSCAAPGDPGESRPCPGEKLSEILVEAARGRLIKIHQKESRARFSRKEMAVVLDGIEAAFQGGRRGSPGRSLSGESLGMVLE